MNDMIPSSETIDRLPTDLLLETHRLVCWRLQLTSWWQFQERRELHTVRRRVEKAMRDRG